MPTYSPAGGPLPPLPPELDPRRRRRSGSTQHRLVRAFTVLCTALSVTIFLLFGVAWWKYRTFNQELIKLVLPGHSSKGDIDGKDQNLLVVGNDDRSDATPAELQELATAGDGGSLNTDTMMIIHIPANGAKATLISLPRDSWVNIPGFGDAKLNAAYPDAYTATNGSLTAKREAGAALLIQVVHSLTGLSIDHFVSVDLLGFYRISNAIGGVPVDMCNAVQDSYSGINLHAGINYVQGTQALAFVRQRHGLPGSDLDRVKRQQYFLTAAFRRVTSAGVLLNPLKLQHLLNAVKSSLYIDSTLDPQKLATQLINLSANNIAGQTIPTTPVTLSDGTDILQVDPAAVKRFIQTVIGTSDKALAAAKPGSPVGVTVNVLNGGATNGAAATNAATLHTAGFTTTFGNTDTTSITTIEFSNGQESAAKTVAEYVPGAALVNVSGLAHVTLVLGTDGLSARSSLPAPSTAKPTGTTSPSATTPATPAPKPIDASCIN